MNDYRKDAATLPDPNEAKTRQRAEARVYEVKRDPTEDPENVRAAILAGDILATEVARLLDQDVIAPNLLDALDTYLECRGLVRVVALGRIVFKKVGK